MKSLAMLVLIVAMLAAILVLVGCGGSGSGGDNPPLTPIYNDASCTPKPPETNPATAATVAAAADGWSVHYWAPSQMDIWDGTHAFPIWAFQSESVVKAFSFYQDTGAGVAWVVTVEALGVYKYDLSSRPNSPRSKIADLGANKFVRVMVDPADATLKAFLSTDAAGQTTATKIPL